tara:strand:+ start:5688 stop:6782 length:1095 start_codon:yes stop_codon:yes gene_type:complete
MTLLRKLHRWLGLLIGSVIFFTSLSGTILAFKQDLIRLSIPGETPVYRPTSDIMAAQALAQISGPDTRYVTFPQPGSNYFIHITAERQVYHHPQSFAPLETRFAIPEILAFLSDLHIHLLAGHDGETVLGFIGLVLVFLILGGLILWFPGRRGFQVKKSLPASLKRGALLHSHRSLGALSSLMILLLTLTGTGLVFYETSRTILHGLYLTPGPAPRRPPQVTPVRNSAQQPWSDILATVRQALPDGHITRYYAPDTAQTATVRFRLRYPEDWTPNGGSYVEINPYTAAALGVTDYRQAPPPDRLARKFFPLHAGHVGGMLYQILIALSGVALAMMIFTGILAWLKSKKRAKLKPLRPQILSKKP